MAQSFEDAVVASLVAGMNPQAGMLKDYAAAQIGQINDAHRESRVSQLERVSKLFQHAKDSGADGRIVDAWDRMLNEITATT